MRDVFDVYFSGCLNDFSIVFIVSAVVFAVTVIVVGQWKGRKWALGNLFSETVVVILYMTVFSRPIQEQIKLSLMPFSSYKVIADGDLYIVPQIIMNVVVFVPFGFLMCGYFTKWSWKRVIACGALLSVGVELLQLVLLRGTTEVDDVIHNTLGCAIGVLLFKVGKGLSCLKV